MIFCSRKRGPTPSVCSRKAPGRNSPPRSSCSKRSGLERSLRRLFRYRNETELFQLGHHIVVAVETDDLPLPDLQDKTGRGRSSVSTATTIFPFLICKTKQHRSSGRG